MSSTSSPLRYSWSTCCYLSVATRNFTCARRGGHVAARQSERTEGPRVDRRYRRPRVWSEHPRSPGEAGPWAILCY